MPGRHPSRTTEGWGLNVRALPHLEGGTASRRLHPWTKKIKGKGHLLYEFSHVGVVLLIRAADDNYGIVAIRKRHDVGLTGSDPLQHLGMVSVHVILLEMLHVLVANLVIPELHEHLDLGSEPPTRYGLIRTLKSMTKHKLTFPPRDFSMVFE
jgi:hypothetical protein